MRVRTFAQACEMSYRIGILDKSACRRETAAQAHGAYINAGATRQARGYHRFWIAEHPQYRSAGRPHPAHSPGSGGVMLQHYSPYKVAENF